MDNNVNWSQEGKTDVEWLNSSVFLKQVIRALANQASTPLFHQGTIQVYVQYMDAAIDERETLRILASSLASLDLQRTYDGNYECPFQCGVHVEHPSFPHEHAAACVIRVANVITGGNTPTS